MKNRILLITLAILTLGLLVPANVRAEDEPEPGVGRISMIHGDVSTMRGDSSNWVATTVNAPVVAGDKVATAARSRAEIQLDYANVLRLDQSTEAKIADLTRTKMQIQVSTGLVDLSVFKGTEADVEIDTPNMAVRPLGEGVYRIEVNSTSQTQLIVRLGEAEVSTPQGSTKVEKGQVIHVQGTDSPEFQIDQAQAKDDWDKWNNDRDRQIADAQAWSHTDRYYTGASDLDAHGHWVDVPGYDWCWTPYVDLGWVPYRSGRWSWEPYWGWTWVSYEPWGWAPYHYGRWFFYGSSWCWWPGRGFYGARPLWGPGYVSFFGFGGRHGGVGVGFGFGSIGWLPLGPHDGFSPWWGHGRSFNVTNITNINGSHGPVIGHPGRGPFGSNLQNVMTNTHVRGALTTVSTQNFVNGRIAHNLQPVNENMLRQAGVVRGTLPVVPTQASLQPGNRAVNPAGLPSARANGERFFTKNPAPATHMPSFSTEANQIREMAQRGPTASAGQGGRPGTNGLRTGGQTTPAARPGVNPQSPATRSNPAVAERTAPATGQPSTQLGRERVGGVTSQAVTPGWQRFGSQPAPNAGRTGAAQTTPRATPAPRGSESRTAGPQGQPGGWQHFTPQPRASTGAAGAARPYEQRSRGSSGWNTSAPRSGGSTYGGARPPLELNRPIMRERSGAGGSYGGGGRTYSAPSGGGHTYSAPRGGGGGGGGGGHTYSAPRGGGGGGGGHSSGSHGKH
ncbi:MAG: DUF6600 domain-containing protein [Terriglobia bacterium]|jgi:hypothetical protein